jgi:hypothetical protein
MRAALAVCLRAAACRRGFFHPSPPRPVTDDLCGRTDEIRRCAAAARVSFAGSPPAPPASPTADDAVSLRDLARAPVEVAPRDCGFFQVATASEVVRLAVGVGERWRLFLDDSGRLQGEMR